MASDAEVRLRISAANHRELTQIEIEEAMNGGGEGGG